MNYKYVLGIIATLNLSSMLAAKEEINYKLFRDLAISSDVALIYKALELPRSDADIDDINFKRAFFENSLRTAVVGLSAANLMELARLKPDKLTTDLLLGWTLNQFDNFDIYHLGVDVFSKLLDIMTDNISDKELRDFLKKKFTSVQESVQLVAPRFNNTSIRYFSGKFHGQDSAHYCDGMAFLHKIRHLPYAIEQSRGSLFSAPRFNLSMHDVLDKVARAISKERKKDEQRKIATLNLSSMLAAKEEINYELFRYLAISDDVTLISRALELYRSDADIDDINFKRAFFENSLRTAVVGLSAENLMSNSLRVFV